MAHPAMPRRASCKAVETIGRALPDVELTTAWGQPALKVRGKMFVCIASHKYAEPNTLAVSYPCVLVRLSRVRADALRDLVTGAHRYVSAKVRTKVVRR